MLCFGRTIFLKIQDFINSAGRHPPPKKKIIITKGIPVIIVNRKQITRNIIYNLYIYFIFPKLAWNMYAFSTLLALNKREKMQRN